MIQVNYSQQEIQVLAKLLDLAVKAGGMAVAGDAFVLHQKLAHAVERAQKDKVAEKTED